MGDLQDFAAPDGAQSEVDLARGLRSTLRLWASREGIAVRLDLPPDLPHIAGEARGLNQVFLNLLKNAAEAFEGGGGSIQVAAHAAEDFVQVTISDDGPGIPAEHAARVFEPFFSMKGEARGSDLGLSICRRIVEPHAGRLELESAVGEGTRVLLTLPRRTSGAEGKSGAAPA